jgi:uncharacterized protein YuzE
MVDYDPDNSILFIKFSHPKIVDGEQASDGSIILHYGERDEIIGVEILELPFPLKVKLW